MNLRPDPLATARPAPGPAVRIEGVERSYAGRRVVGPLNLEVQRGQTVALLGPSGCGKSTLLRMLVGLVRPERGRLEVLGRALEESSLPDVRLSIGYVIQEGGLFPHLTAAENVALLARDQGWPPTRIAARIDELARLAHLPGELLGRYPAQLSGGQRQRVALMRALALDPGVLLLDEPLGALDPMIRARLQDELAALFRTLGRAVLLVTHDLAEAAALADEIVLLRAGRIVQRGTWHDLVERPADDFVADFVAAQARGVRT